MYAEASYFDGAHFQHIADRLEHLRLERLRTQASALVRRAERRGRPR